MTSEITSWKKIGCNLSKDTLFALKRLKFLNPTPIQIHAIPTFLTKKDIVAQAVTGSGKTLSFIIPIMELLSNASDIKATDIFSIILSPTTELANQTCEMFNDFLAHYKGLKPLVKLFKKSDDEITDGTNKGIVLISTPGGLAKAFDVATQSSKIMKSTKTLEVLIMDEADRLLDMGFSAQLQSIIKVLPKQRLTALFSATQTTEVEDLVRTGMRNPVRVCVKVTKGLVTGSNDTLPKGLTNYHLTIDYEKKLDVLIRFLQDNADKKVLVFFATCLSVDYFNRILTQVLKKHKILCMHRKLKNKRTKVFQDFKTIEKGVMLCTDIMARGIDIPNIDWVVQYDPPKSASNFVHRCGRTARGEETGQTLLLLQPNEDVYLNFLSHNQNVQMDEYKYDYDLETLKTHHSQMQDICTKDRLVYEKSVKAFVSYVEFYRKHELKYIFKLKDINMGKLANSFGLLRMPQMRELKNVDQSDFKKSEVDLKSLIYKEKSVRVIKEKTMKIKQDRKKAEEENPTEGGVKSKRDIKKEKELKKAARKNKKAFEKKSAANREEEEANSDEMEVEEAPRKESVREKKVEVPSKKRKASSIEGSGLLSFAKKSKL